MQTLKVALIQLNSRGEKDRNLEQAEQLVREAADHGAALAVLPEYFNLLGP